MCDHLTTIVLKMLSGNRRVDNNLAYVADLRFIFWVDNMQNFLEIFLTENTVTI